MQLIDFESHIPKASLAGLIKEETLSELRRLTPNASQGQG
jgi:hypothetical protein